MCRILITYHSVYGSTARTAEWISERIGGDVLPVKEVKNLEKYDLIVIGTPVFDEESLGPVGIFVNENKDILLQKKVALFAVCLDTKDLFIGGRRIGPVASLQSLIDTLEGKPILAQGLGGELNPSRLTKPHYEMLQAFYKKVGIGPADGSVPYKTKMNKEEVWNFAERLMRRYKAHTAREK